MFCCNANFLAAKKAIYTSLFLEKTKVYLSTEPISTPSTNTIRKLSVYCLCPWEQSGPSCSKLTISLVNDSLKFTSGDTQNMLKFFAEKM